MFDLVINCIRPYSVLPRIYIVYCSVSVMVSYIYHLLMASQWPYQFLEIFAYLCRSTSHKPFMSRKIKVSVCVEENEALGKFTARLY